MRSALSSTLNQRVRKKALPKLAKMHIRQLRRPKPTSNGFAKKQNPNPKTTAKTISDWGPREPEQGESRSAGLQTFLVVKQPGSFPEGMTGRVIDKIGYHGFLTWHLELDRVRVPENDRLTGLYGDEGADADSGGFAAVQKRLEHRSRTYCG